MRILYAGPVPPLRGGIAQHGGRLVDAFRDLGHEVDVLSWSKQYPDTLYPGERQTDRTADTYPGARYDLHWGAPWTWRLGSRWDPDVLVAPWVTPFQSFALRKLVSSVRPVPAVAVVHNPLPHESHPMAVPLTRLGLGSFSGAVVHASSVRSVLAEVVPDLPARIALHPPNLPLAAVPPPPLGRVKLLLFGFVRPYKGVETALGAAADLLRRGIDVELTIAGEVWREPAEFQLTVEAFGLDGRLHLHPGYVPDEEVGPLIADHHVVLVPYRQATQSGVIPLAYAVGRPVVATSVGGLPDQVVDEVTGALCRPGDPTDLADAVGRVVDDYETMSRNVVDHVPSWLNLAATVLDAVRDGESEVAAMGVPSGEAYT